MNTEQLCTITSNKAVKKYFYVYVHRKSSDGSIFYVGKGTGNRAYVKTKRSKYWNNVVNKYGYTVEIIQNYLPEWLAFELETYLIAEYRLLGYNLCNLTEGGEGASGCTRSEETKLKNKIASTGFKHTEKTKEKLRKLNTGRRHTEKTKEKLKIYHTGLKASQATKDKMSKSHMGIPLTEKVKKKISESKSGVKHPLARPANIYDYKSNALIAENVLIALWSVENGYNQGALASTARADRNAPNSKSNPLQHKGIYAIYIK